MRHEQKESHTSQNKLSEDAPSTTETDNLVAFAVTNRSSIHKYLPKREQEDKLFEPENVGSSIKESTFLFSSDSSSPLNLKDSSTIKNFSQRGLDSQTSSYMPKSSDLLNPSRRTRRSMTCTPVVKAQEVSIDDSNSARSLKSPSNTINQRARRASWSESSDPNSTTNDQTRSTRKSSFDLRVPLVPIVTTRKRNNSEGKKPNFVQRNLLPSKLQTISMPFDAFVDKVKGTEDLSTASNYPSHKIDKRLIFLGREVDYPWHIISYYSSFRSLWNLFITAIILYEIFWYPLAAAFIYNDEWPKTTLIFEIVSIFIFAFDIIINIRTTYTNDNNEEIIDSKMIRQRYMKQKLFIIDVITMFPLPEILCAAFSESGNRWIVYSLVVLIRMLRIFKISVYLRDRMFHVIYKLLKIFITFFILVHWASCIWYVVISFEHSDKKTTTWVWFPNNLRMIAINDSELLDYYYTMDTIRVYSWTLLSVFMLAVGGDMAPATDMQIWMSVVIGLFGAVAMSYIFGLATVIMNSAYEENSRYQHQFEVLQRKLNISKVPCNLRAKVMEYFYYSWRKNQVLKKVDDFSELSIPLQRDIALYQHQEMVIKVPLFRELDPVEILSIIQKLRTAIYMPGDKILREKERGTEMFFIQEGMVEKVVRRIDLKNQRQYQTGVRYEKTYLKVALLSNSKRIFDVNAYEFCILYSFSRNDYENLKREFRDIGPRLRSGLKHYKNTHMTQLIQILKNLEIFQNFTEAELQNIIDSYLEEIFVDPEKVVLSPKDKINAIYILLAGSVNCYNNDDETRNYVSNLKRSNAGNNWTVVDMDEEDVDYLDDQVLDPAKDKFSMDDDKNRLDLLQIYRSGDYFGTLDFDVNEVKCNKYYLSDGGCQIGIITQSMKSQMALEDPQLYDKLRNNIIKISAPRVMMPIEEESDDSFTTKNTFAKYKMSRRGSALSDCGLRPIVIKTSTHNFNKDEDLSGVKEELHRIEDELNQFRGLMTAMNIKLGRVLTNNHMPRIHLPDLSLQSKSKVRIINYPVLNQKPLEKRILSREIEDELTGVNEVDQAEESRSIRKDEDIGQETL